MDLAIQAKLLKVIEERRFRRIGGVTEIEVDVRILAATHRDLAREAQAGRFRSDLLYRLDVFAIRLPSLRERREEVVALARRFLAEARGGRDGGAAAGAISDAAARLLEGYGWPGNVRELRNVMERAAILCPRGEVQPSHLPPLAQVEPRREAAHDGDDGEDGDDDDRSLRGAERRFLEAALRENGGNIQATARALGVSRGTLYRKISRYKLATRDE
jgi:DNA-binding NtrC family response regulator